MVDDAKLKAFRGKMLRDLGAAISVPLVRTGIRLGLYKVMDDAGPLTSAEVAEKAGISERYAREWLAQNAASGYLTYEAASKRFELPTEHAFAFAREDSPYFLGGNFEVISALYQAQPLVEKAFVSGGASIGAIMPAVSSARSGRCFAPATLPISCRTGCLRSTAFSKSCSAARRSPTWAAARANRP